MRDSPRRCSDKNAVEILIPLPSLDKTAESTQPIPGGEVKSLRVLKPDSGVDSRVNKYRNQGGNRPAYCFAFDSVLFRHL